MKKTRNRKRPPLSLQERLSGSAEEARSAAEKLPPGFERDQLVQKAQKREAAARIDRWLSSPGLRRPE